MKILNTEQKLLSLKGETLKEGTTDITVGLVVTNLLSNTPKNPHRAYQLAKQIATEKEVSLKAEDVVFIKEVLTSQTGLGSLYIGQIIDILETPDTK